MLEGREGRAAGVVVRARGRMVRGDLGAERASEEVGKLNEVGEKESLAVQVGRAEQEGGDGSSQRRSCLRESTRQGPGDM